MKLGTYLFGGLGGLVGLTLIAQPPASAAMQGRIVVSTRGGFSGARNAFVFGGCRSEIVGIVNGTDGAIFDISGYPVGTTVNIDWAGVVAPTGQLLPSLYTSGCTAIPSRTGGSASAPGRLTVLIQQPTKWLVIDGSGLANINLTVS
jgi:hypothetical protein